MLRTIVLACFVSLLCIATIAQEAPRSPRIAQLLATERAWLDTYQSRDAEAMARIEADEFQIVYPDGTVRTKKQEVDALRKPVSWKPDPTSATGTRDTRVMEYGDVVVLAGVFFHKGTHQQGPEKGKTFLIESRYTDVWVWRDGRWQVVASQLTRLQDKN